MKDLRQLDRWLLDLHENHPVQFHLLAGALAGALAGIVFLMGYLLGAK